MHSDVSCNFTGLERGVQAVRSKQTTAALIGKRCIGLLETCCVDERVLVVILALLGFIVDK